MSDPLWQKAAAMSAEAHRHQVRRDGCTPYASHPTRVALTIATLFDCRDEAVLAAALLHDTIEDSPIDYDDIADTSGPEVADLVAAMTKDMRRVEHEREPAYDEQLAAASWKARIIKLADVYDNLSDSMPHDVSEKILEKVRRAIELAADDDELGQAVTVVRALLARAETMAEA